MKTLSLSLSLSLSLLNKSSSPQKRALFLGLFFAAFLLFTSQALNALTYPSNTPLGEVEWGYFHRNFTNLFTPACPPWQAIIGFQFPNQNLLHPNTGKPLCAPLAGSASSLTGALSWQDGRIPVWSNNGTLFTGSLLYQSTDNSIHIVSKHADGARFVWSGWPNNLYEYRSRVNQQGTLAFFSKESQTPDTTALSLTQDWRTGIGTHHPSNALTITKNADVHGTQTTQNNGTLLIQDNLSPNNWHKLFIDSNEIQSTYNGNPEWLSLNPYGWDIIFGWHSGNIANSGNAPFLFIIPKNSTWQLRFTQNAQANYIQSGTWGKHGDAKDLRFTPIGSTRPWMSIAAQTGNVGIGTHNPQAKLDVHWDALINGHHIGRWGGNNQSNIAFWHGAFQNNVSWYSNTALGYRAMAQHRLGDSNIAIGLHAMNQYANTYENVAVGVDTLKHTVGWRDNTAIGTNVFEHMQNGFQNVWLGINAGTGLLSGQRNIFIGANTKPLSATASNQLNIGNWIYGNNGDIGIATPNPTNALTITKNADVHGTHTTPNNGTILIQDDPRPNIGYKLFMDANEIQATTGNTPTGLALNPYGWTINIGWSSGALASPENASFLFTIPQTSIGQLRFMQSTEANYIQSGIWGRHGDAKDLRFTPIGATRPWMSIVAQTGNVGINTNNPQSKLHINGNIQLGNENNTCNPTAEWQMRYSRTLKAMEYCDGTQWKSVWQWTPRWAIMAFYRSTCPAGWIPANGTNSTPDLRGEFIRGWDNGRGIDVGR